MDKTKQVMKPKVQKAKKQSKSIKILSRKNIIDNQINVFDKVKTWLLKQNEFKNLELLSEVVSQQQYLTENNKLNVKMINQCANNCFSNDSNLNQAFKNILLS